MQPKKILTDLKFVKEGSLTRVNGNKSKKEVARELFSIVKKMLV